MSIKFNIKINKKVITKDGQPVKDAALSDKAREVEGKLARMNPIFFLFIKPLNTIAILVGLWAFILPTPYRVAISACVFLPPLAVFSFIYSQGVVPFDAPKGSKALHTAYVLWGPSSVIAWRAFMDYHLLNAHSLWTPLLIFFAPFVILIVYFGTSFKVGVGKYLIALPFLLIYSFGVVVEANGLLDKSMSQTYSATVLSKDSTRSSRGPASYYLMVSPRGPRITDNRVNISRKLFEGIQVNGQVRIFVKQGYLNIPYYAVTQ